MVITCVIRMLFDNNEIYLQPVRLTTVTELATVTPHIVAISVLISMVDFSLDIVA